MFWETAVTPAEMRADIERSLYAIAKGIDRNLLDSATRRQLLHTAETLTLLWEQLLARGEGSPLLTPDNLRFIRTLTRLCILAESCSEEELTVLAISTHRLTSGWRMMQSILSSVEPRRADEETVVSVTADVAVPTPPATVPSPDALGESVKDEPVLLEAEQPTVPAAEEPAAQPSRAEETVSVATEPTLMEWAPETAAEERQPYEGLSEWLDELGQLLDKVENRMMPKEEKIALLNACACLYRLLRQKAVHWQREWEVNRQKAQLERLAREVWLPALDPKFDYSEHELQTLLKAYRALPWSWEAWRWYQQYADMLDKNGAKPLLESIAAPLPMTQQIYTAHQIETSKLSDSTSQLYIELVEEAKRRNWKLDMLTPNCERKKQEHYLQKAEEHWACARKQVETKQAQKAALTRVRDVLSMPNPDTFEQDILAALVQCHLAQIPYSNLELRDIMQGYGPLLQNPDVPDTLNLTSQQKSAARKFLVNLGKKLDEDQRQSHREPENGEEPFDEPNSELLQQARRHTAGKKMLLLCFNRRATAEQRIREDLQLAELDWPDLDGTESIASLESRIRNADITVVVPRFSRTHWKEAADIAKKHQKQFVMATKGYGVTHLAQQIAQQCPGG